MKTIAVFVALVAVALAAPQRAREADKQTYLTEEVPSNNIGLDNYEYGFKQSDGQERHEAAQVETRAAPEESVLRVRGYYSFVGDDGQLYKIEYIADENGFQPQGAHIPSAA